MGSRTLAYPLDTWYTEDKRKSGVGMAEKIGLVLGLWILGATIVGLVMLFH